MIKIQNIKETIPKNIQIKLIKSKLRIKIGLDPTGQSLHIGHLIILHQLKEMQKLGHMVYCIIGTYTAQIGDPSGSNKLRKTLKYKEVLKNCKIYEKQILNVLYKHSTKIVYNTTWLNRIKSTTFLKLLTTYTVSRMLKRKEFKQRLFYKKPISICEFIYPLLQGYDSVILNADVEIGGVDQKFNLLVGRYLQNKYHQKKQIIITVHLLCGIDGKVKMSKTLKNSIDLNETSQNIFGKTMSLLDEYVDHYFYMLNFKKLTYSHIFLKKLSLSYQIVALLYNKNIAKIEKNFFINHFSKKRIVTKNIETMFCENTKQNDLSLIIQTYDKNYSKKQIKRLIMQNGIKVNNVIVKCLKQNIVNNSIVSIGKKIRLKIKFF